MTDYVDKRGGAYDLVNSTGNPHPQLKITRPQARRTNGVRTFGPNPYLDLPGLARALRACRAEAVWPGWGAGVERVMSLKSSHG